MYFYKQFLRVILEIGKYQAMLIFFTGFAIMGVSLENVSISYVLSYAQCDLNFSTHQKGVLTAISFLGIVSTSYFWGFFVDTVGRQKVLSVSAFGGFIFSFLSAFSPNFYSLVVFRFLAGSMQANHLFLERNIDAELENVLLPTGWLEHRPVATHMLANFIHINWHREQQLSQHFNKMLCTCFYRFRLC